MAQTAIQLPPYCYSVMPSNEQLIRIDRQESGYRPVTIGEDQRHVFGNEAKTLANELNATADIPHNVRNAMEHGSMCGWESLGADPDTKWNQSAKAL